MFDVDMSRMQAVNMQKFVMEQTKDLREPVNYNAFYSAIVTNTNDTLGLGRVQIRIPALHGSNENQAYFIPDNTLPWARPGVFNASGNDMGQFLVPEKGTRIFVTFELNDPNSPIYFGGIPTMIGASGNTKDYNDNQDIYGGENVVITDNDTMRTTRDTKALNTIFKSFKGATIEIDDKDGQETIRIISADGQVFEMGVEDPEGTPLDRRGDREGSTNSHRYIKLGNENEYIKIVDGKITIAAENIEIDGYAPTDVQEVYVGATMPTSLSTKIWIDTSS